MFWAAALHNLNHAEGADQGVERVPAAFVQRSSQFRSIDSQAVPIRVVDQLRHTGGEGADERRHRDQAPATRSAISGLHVTPSRPGDPPRSPTSRTPR